MEWLKQQGPWCPALIEYLRRNQQQYDVLIFFTYLYAPTVLGLEVNPGKSVLVSTAHDEPAIRLEIFKDVFSRPGRALLPDRQRAAVRPGRVPRPAAARRGRRRRRRHPAAAAVPADAGRARGRCRSAGRRRATIADAGRGRRGRARVSRRTSWPAARCSGGATGCTDRSSCTAAGSIPARAARS